MPTMEQLQFAEPSEANPLLSTTPPPLVADTVHAPPAEPVQQPIRPIKTSTKVFFIIFTIVMNSIYAVFLYYTTRATAEPLPRGIVNQTYRGFGAFQAFMWMVGAIVMLCDGFLLAAFLMPLLEKMKTRDWRSFIAFMLSYALVVGFSMSIFSLTWVVPTVVSTSTYTHACDSDWLEILITGHTWLTAASRNVAKFYLVSPTKKHELLWTWTSNDPFQNDFNLVGLNSTNPSVLPSLSNVTINHATNEVERAWCYGTTKPCATGYVWPFDGLFFEVQFNGTLTRMRNVCHDWSFDNAPSVVMHRVDESGQLAERLMQTSIQNPNLCREMKVCVSHAMRRREGAVDPDVLVAAYWLLHKQAVSATKCTARRGKHPAT